MFPRSPCSPSYTILWQGLLPLTELSICPIDGSREHAFQITGVWRELAWPPLDQDLWTWHWRSTCSPWRGNFPEGFCEF